MEPDEEKGLLVYLGAEFYPPAPAEREPEAAEGEAEEVEEPQPIVAGQPSAFADPVPEPAPRRVTRRRKPPDQQPGVARKPRARRPPTRPQVPPDGSVIPAGRNRAARMVASKI